MFTAIVGVSLTMDLNLDLVAAAMLPIMSDHSSS